MAITCNRNSDVVKHQIDRAERVLWLCPATPVPPRLQPAGLHGCLFFVEAAGEGTMDELCQILRC